MWGSGKESGTSNFKEFDNLVETLEVMRDDEDGLNGVELFMFTDNSVTEGAVYKGSPTSRNLFDLVLRLMMLELECDTRVIFVHVTGARMIEQGTVALSKGNILEGVILCRSMLSFVPLHEDA